MLPFLSLKSVYNYVISEFKDQPPLSKLLTKTLSVLLVNAINIILFSDAQTGSWHLLLALEDFCEKNLFMPRAKLLGNIHHHTSRRGMEDSLLLHPIPACLQKGHCVSEQQLISSHSLKQLSLQNPPLQILLFINTVLSNADISLQCINV